MTERNGTIQRGESEAVPHLKRVDGTPFRAWGGVCRRHMRQLMAEVNVDHLRFCCRKSEASGNDPQVGAVVHEMGRE